MEDLNLRLGPYRLTQLLGRGGMGVVYQAEQLEPVRREVAIKLINPGAAGMDAVVQRFQSERQALAVMEHPSIARVFDNGLTEDGRPYFVMELVRGVSLLEYCDERRLSLEARTHLFVQICRAVQHAHQKGVIHRDLKPSNILVTEVDGQPLAKVIDFGIARSVVTAEGVERLTFAGQLIGTPAYMSPEQFTVGTDIDTRSDVYALGVVLFELLTGVLPFDQTVYRSLALFGAAAAATPTPAQRFSKLGVIARDVASRRGVDPAALIRALRSDFDWIVMKAMDEDRERRYDSANALAQDLERSLAHQPVLARPPNRVYQARKFARRHRVGVASGVVIVMLVLGGVVSQTMQARKVALARDEAVARRGQAEGLIDFMLGDLWTRLEPVGQLGILNAVGERAVDYYSRIDPALLSDAEAANRSRMLYNIGEVRMRQGNSTAATNAFEESWRLAEVLAARRPDDADLQFKLAQSEFWVASGYYRQTRFANAKLHFQAYRDISRALVARDSTKVDWIKELGYSHTNLGAVELALGRGSSAAEEFRAALRVKERILANEPDDRSLRYDVARGHYNLAEALIVAGNLSDAEGAVDRDIAIKRTLLALDSTNAVWRNTLVNSLTARATVVSMLGHGDSALAALTEAGSIIETLRSRDPTNREWDRSRAINAVRRADILMKRAEFRVARAFLTPATEALENLVAADTARLELRQDLAYARRLVAVFELLMGRLEAARDFAAAAAALLPNSAPAGTPRLLLLHGASARLTEGTALSRLGDSAAARVRWRDAELLTASLIAEGDDPVALATAAEARLRLARRAEADELLNRLRRTGYKDAAFIERLRDLGVSYE